MDVAMAHAALRLTRILALAGVLALAGCAGGVASSWGHGGAENEERAVLGIENSDVIDLIIECAPGGRAVRFVFPDVADRTPGDVELGASGDSFSGREMIEGAPDAAMGVVTVPIGHPLLARIAAGARRLSIGYDGKRSSVALGVVPRQTVAACIAGI